MKKQINEFISQLVILAIVGNIFMPFFSVSNTYATENNNIKSILELKNIENSKLQDKRDIIEGVNNISLKSIKGIEKPYIEGEVLIKYKENSGNLFSSSFMTTKEDIISRKNLILKEKFVDLNIMSVKSDKISTNKIIEILSEDDDIEYIQPNFIYKTTSNDPDYSKLWGLDNSGQEINGSIGVDDIDMDWSEAINTFPGTNNGTGVIVAVIDTGVDYTNEDLENKMWDGSNCKDYNGEYLGGCISGYDFNDMDKNPMAGHYHGTHVAGTIAAEGNNSKGLIGVNPQAKIMAVKGFEYSSTSVRAINFAKHNGAKIINASWGGYFLNGHDCDDTTIEPYVDEAMYDAIKSFGEVGGLFIAAAGNGSENHDNVSTRMFPAGYGETFECSGKKIEGLDNIISVAAINNKGEIASFSDYGSDSVHIGAPGVDIYSTLPTESSKDYILGFEDFDSYSTGSFSPNWLTFSTGSNWGLNNIIWTGDENKLQGDLNNPYLTGITSYAESSTIDLSGKTPEMFFRIDCRLPESNNGADYMSLEFSSDNGNNYNEIKRFDGDGYNFYPTEIYLDNTYLNSDFKFRFKWVSGNDNDTGMGCGIDNFYLATEGEKESKYGFLNGTSMAAPNVAGAVSLAWSYKQDMSAANIKEAILESGDNLSSLNGKTISGKKINLNNALNYLDNFGNMLDHFEVTSSSGTFDISHSPNITIKAINKNGNINTSYTGSLGRFIENSDVLTLTGELALHNYNFVDSDNGIKTFTGLVNFIEIGNHKIIFYDINDDKINGNIEFNVTTNSTNILETTLSTDSPSSDIKILPGEEGVLYMGIDFTAGDTDLNINNIDFVLENANNFSNVWLTKNKDPNTGTFVTPLITTTGVEFNNISFDILAGETKTLYLYANHSSNGGFGSNNFFKLNNIGSNASYLVNDNLSSQKIYIISSNATSFEIVSSHSEIDIRDKSDLEITLKAINEIGNVDTSYTGIIRFAEGWFSDDDGEYNNSDGLNGDNYIFKISDNGEKTFINLKNYSTQYTFEDFKNGFSSSTGIIVNGIDLNTFTPTEEINYNTKTLTGNIAFSGTVREGDYIRVSAYRGFDDYYSNEIQIKPLTNPNDGLNEDNAIYDLPEYETFAREAVFNGNIALSGSYDLDGYIAKRDWAKQMSYFKKRYSNEVSLSCIGKFTDMSDSDYGCKYAEDIKTYIDQIEEHSISSDCDEVSQLLGLCEYEPYAFNPDYRISKINFVKGLNLIMGINESSTDNAGVVKNMYDLGVIDSEFTDYNTAVKNGLAYKWIAKMIDYSNKTNGYINKEIPLVVGTNNVDFTLNLFDAFGNFRGSKIDLNAYYISNNSSYASKFKKIDFKKAILPTITGLNQKELLTSQSKSFAGKVFFDSSTIKAGDNLRITLTKYDGSNTQELDLGDVFGDIEKASVGKVKTFKIPSKVKKLNNDIINTLGGGSVNEECDEVSQLLGLCEDKNEIYLSKTYTLSGGESSIDFDIALEGLLVNYDLPYVRVIYSTIDAEDYLYDFDRVVEHQSIAFENTSDIVLNSPENLSFNNSIKTLSWDYQTQTGVLIEGFNIYKNGLKIDRVGTGVTSYSFSGILNAGKEYYLGVEAYKSYKLEEELYSTMSEIKISKEGYNTTFNITLDHSCIEYGTARDSRIYLNLFPVNSQNWRDYKYANTILDDTTERLEINNLRNGTYNYSLWTEKCGEKKGTLLINGTNISESISFTAGKWVNIEVRKNTSNGLLLKGYNLNLIQYGDSSLEDETDGFNQNENYLNDKYFYDYDNNGTGSILNLDYIDYNLEIRDNLWNTKNIKSIEVSGIPIRDDKLYKGDYGTGNTIVFIVDDGNVITGNTNILNGYISLYSSGSNKFIAGSAIRFGEFNLMGVPNGEYKLEGFTYNDQFEEYSESITVSGDINKTIVFNEVVEVANGETNNLFEGGFDKDFAIEANTLKLKLNPNDNSSGILNFASGSDIFKNNSTYLVYDGSGQIVNSGSIDLSSNNNLLEIANNNITVSLELKNTITKDIKFIKANFGNLKITLPIQRLRFDSPATVKQDTNFKVNGIAPKNAFLELQYNGETIGTGSVNNGLFEIETKIINSGSGILQIKDTINNIVSEASNIEVNSTLPILKGYKINIDGEEIINNNSIDIEYFSVWTDYEMRVKSDININATFENIPDSIEYYISEQEADSAGTIIKGWEDYGTKDVIVKYTKSGKEYNQIIAKLIILIDPSGYVYNSTTNAKVDGLKSTLYKLVDNRGDLITSSTGSDQTKLSNYLNGGYVYGDLKDDLDVCKSGDLYPCSWVIYDAETYGQINSQYTDVDGKYGWDVPEGYFHVKFEDIDGDSNGGDYGTFDSFVTYIPPVVTDLNIGKTSVCNTNNTHFDDTSSECISDIETEISTNYDKTRVWGGISWGIWTYTCKNSYTGADCSTAPVSSSSGGGGGGGGGGSRTPICIDTNLICKETASNTFKFYRKEGVSCRGGNLAKTCDIKEVLTEVKKEIELVKSVKKTLSIKTPILEKIFNSKNITLKNIDNNLSGLSYLGDDIEILEYEYINDYNSWIKSIEKVEEYLLNKDKDLIKLEFTNFLKIYSTLEGYKNIGEINSTKINGTEIKYIKYSNKTIKRIQTLLFNKVEKKEENIDMYKLANRVSHNLNKLVIDKTLTKLDIKEIRTKTIVLYKDFIKLYNETPKKIIKKETIAEKINRINAKSKIIEKETITEKIKRINTKKLKEVSEVLDNTIMTVNVRSVKLKRDEWLKYFHAMLEEGDTVKILEKDISNGLLKIEILTSRIKNYIGRQGYVFEKYLK